MSFSQLIIQRPLPQRSVTRSQLTLIAFCIFAFSGVLLSTSSIAEIIVSPGESIQDAINISTAGETISVEPGTYVEDLVIDKSITLVSTSGTAATKIIGIAKLPETAFPLAAPNIDIQADDVKISGFSIESPTVSADEYSSGIVLDGTNIEISNNEFVVATGSGSTAIQTWVSSPSTGTSDISGLSIRNSTFTHLTPLPGGALDLYQAVFINPQTEPVDASNPVFIENNQFSGRIFGAVGIARSDVVVRNNDFSSIAVSVFPQTPVGIRINSFSQGIIHNIVIRGNQIQDFETGIIIDTDLASETDIAINFNSISGNVAGVVYQADPGAASVDARHNWWGDHSGPSGCSTCSGIGDTVDENVEFDPWLTGLPAGEIEVSPEQIEFGTVEVTASSTQIATLSNIGVFPLLISEVSLESGTSGFTIFSFPATPLGLFGGESIDVVIELTPAMTGLLADTLTIVSDDVDESLVTIPLTGTAVMQDVPPSQELAAILEFFDAAVAAGELVGLGPGKSAPGRRGALRNMLESAGDLIDEDSIVEACTQLGDALNRADRGPRPPDFVTGTAVGTLMELLEDLRTGLGCL